MQSEEMIRGTGLLEHGRAYAFFLESATVSGASSQLHVLLTERDQALLNTLTHRVKVLSPDQIQTTWWKNARGAGVLSRRIRQLEDSGWIMRLNMACCGLRPTDAPILTWRPEEPEPTWNRILRVVRQGLKRSLRSVLGVVATPRAANQFGGQARYPRPSEGTHDLLVSSVYLRMLRDRPRDARAWAGEGTLAQRLLSSNTVLPDALIAQRSCPIAIEIVGQSYTPAKLQRFHEFCRNRGWRYELW